mmetsp:Transcript_4058/g.9233  ORF Transcript_4058/g.9233 Transcript_4058/m.9233 type:complete len:81 (-) Transcript_4058:103-345(-)
MVAPSSHKDAKVPPLPFAIKSSTFLVDVTPRRKEQLAPCECFDGGSPTHCPIRCLNRCAQRSLSSGNNEIDSSPPHIQDG